MRSSIPVQVLLFFTIVSHQLCSCAQWNYEDDDNHWTKHYHECSGRSQSPIDIHVKKTKHDPLLSLTFKEYNQPLDGNIFQLTNNGHTVELSLIQSMINPDDIPLIKGPALEEHSYKFVQLHFHWHTNDSLGSEHAIDGQRYALEMHYVHMNTKYKSISEAKEHKDGLAVLGTLFQITRKDNRHLDPLLSGIQRVQKQGSNFTLTGSQITLDDMLPNDLGKFFKYSGSLTTPPCSESVTWFVFKEITGISLKQIQYFREIMTMNEEHVFVPIGHNVRSLQKLRKRDVLASFSSASFIHQSMSVTLSSIFLFMSIKLLNRF